MKFSVKHKISMQKWQVQRNHLRENLAVSSNIMRSAQGGGGDDSGMDRELKAERQVFTHGYREDRETQKDRKLRVVLRVELEDKSTVQDNIRSTQR